MFYITEKPTKDDASLSVMVDSKCHLEIHGYVHAKIVKQLTNHQDLWVPRSNILDQKTDKLVKKSSKWGVGSTILCSQSLALMMVKATIMSYPIVRKMV